MTNSQPSVSNSQIADQLEEIGRLLEDNGENPFRVKAYRNAAASVRGCQRQVCDILSQEGADGLQQIAAVGKSLSHIIERLATNGHVALLSRLAHDANPENSLRSVAGIGPKLASQIHEQLGVENLFELELATYDGRLEALPGIGEKRLRAVREALAGRFRHGKELAGSRKEIAGSDQAEISVEQLLRIDREYILKAKKHSLPQIAPKRFNPTRAAWLPILHKTESGRHYTALFSNSARAHELGMQKDWVVIYLDGTESHWTVVTSRFGQLKGRRIVRGRENECADYYSKLRAVSSSI